jgi:hypothetical protein
VAVEPQGFCGSLPDSRLGWASATSHTNRLLDADFNRSTEGSPERRPGKGGHFGVELVGALCRREGWKLMADSAYGSMAALPLSWRKELALDSLGQLSRFKLERSYQGVPNAPEEANPRAD